MRSEARRGDQMIWERGEGRRRMVRRYPMKPKGLHSRYHRHAKEAFSSPRYARVAPSHFKCSLPEMQ